MNHQYPSQGQLISYIPSLQSLQNYKQIFNEIKKQAKIIENEQQQKMQHLINRNKNILEETQTRITETIKNANSMLLKIEKFQKVQKSHSCQSKKPIQKKQVQKSSLKQDKSKRSCFSVDQVQKNKKIDQRLSSSSTRKKIIKQKKQTSQTSQIGTIRTKNEFLMKQVEEEEEEEQNLGGKLVKNLQTNKMISFFLSQYYWYQQNLEYHKNCDQKEAHPSKNFPKRCATSIAKHTFQFCQICSFPLSSLITEKRKHFKNEHCILQNFERLIVKKKTQQIYAIIKQKILKKQLILLKCPCKEQLFKNQEVFKDHLKVQHGDIAPKLCSHTLRGGKLALNQHTPQLQILQDYIMPNVYYCGICKSRMITTEKRKYIQHLISKHPENTYHPYSSYYFQHHFQHHLPQKSKKVIKKKVQKSLDERIQREQGLSKGLTFLESIYASLNGPFKCDLCLNIFPSISEIHNHFDSQQSSCLKNISNSAKFVKVLIRKSVGMHQVLKKRVDKFNNENNKLVYYFPLDQISQNDKSVPLYFNKRVQYLGRKIHQQYSLKQIFETLQFDRYQKRRFNIDNLY